MTLRFALCLFFTHIKHEINGSKYLNNIVLILQNALESLTPPGSLPRMRNEMGEFRERIGVCRLMPPQKSRLGELFLVFLVCGPLGTAMAASTPPGKAAGPFRSREIVTRLQNKYEATRTLKARFEQENRLRSLGRTTRSQGRFLMSKPGRVRVEYLEPENQLIVSNGKKLWIFTERLNQVIVSDMGGSGSGSIPLLFLAGKGNLAQEFRVELEDEGVPERKGGVWKAAQPHRLSLMPKQASAGFQRMWLEVDPETFHITGLDYVDALGNKTQIRFFDIEEGVAVGTEQFEFEIPSGVEVLRAPGSGGKNR